MLKTALAESLPNLQKNKYEVVKATEGRELTDKQKTKIFEDMGICRKIFKDPYEKDIVCKANTVKVVGRPAEIRIRQIIKGNFLGDGSEVVLINADSYDFSGAEGITGFYIILKNGKVEKISPKYNQDFYFWKFPGKNEELLLVLAREYAKQAGDTDYLYTCKLSNAKKDYYLECYDMSEPVYKRIISKNPKLKKIADDLNTESYIEVVKAYYIGISPNQSEELVVDIKYDIENVELNFRKSFADTIRLKTEDFYKLKKKKLRLGE
ncbi:MAG: hypothetical protein ACPLRS_01690 [Hydrogenobacter sp.]